MTTTDKVASLVEWGIKKLWYTIIDSLSLLSPSVIWDAVCGIFSGIGSLVGKAWNGIKSWWNGEDSSSKITVTLDKKDAESIKKSNETLGTLLENSIPKPDQKGETFFEKIENTLIAIKNKISEGVGLFFDFFQPENLSYAKTKLYKGYQTFMELNLNKNNKVK